jgi:hypothetical protein
LIAAGPLRVAFAEATSSSQRASRVRGRSRNRATKVGGSLFSSASQSLNQPEHPEPLRAREGSVDRLRQMRLGAQDALQRHVEVLGDDLRPFDPGAVVGERLR